MAPIEGVRSKGTSRAVWIVALRAGNATRRPNGREGGVWGSGRPDDSPDDAKVVPGGGEGPHRELVRFLIFLLASIRKADFGSLGEA